MLAARAGSQAGRAAAPAVRRTTLPGAGRAGPCGRARGRAEPSGPIRPARDERSLRCPGEPRGSGGQVFHGSSASWDCADSTIADSERWERSPMLNIGIERRGPQPSWRGSAFGAEMSSFPSDRIPSPCSRSRHVHPSRPTRASCSTLRRCASQMATMAGTPGNCRVSTPPALPRLSPTACRHPIAILTHEGSRMCAGEVKIA